MAGDERRSEPAEIVAVTGVTEVEIQRHTGGATENEGDAPDDDEVDAGGDQDVKESLDVRHAARRRGTAPSPASA